MSEEKPEKDKDKVLVKKTDAKSKKLAALVRFLKSSLAGTLAGAGCVIVGFPLDTVKVRM